MKTLIRAAALSALMAATAAPAALAQAAPPSAETMFRATTLNLAAYGESRVQPDMATISLGVTTQAGSAQAAMQANAAQMTKVVDALRRAGIAAKDIQTSGLNLNPQYVYEQNLPPKLTGYQATNQVTVTVHDLARLGPAVDATVSSGANQVNGIAFGLDDPTAAENAARELAVKALADKAQLYARATGYRVVRLVTLSEGTSSFPIQPPMPMAEFASARMAKAGTTVSAGELKVRVDITGLYELAR